MYGSVLTTISLESRRGQDGKSMLFYGSLHFFLGAFVSRKHCGFFHDFVFQIPLFIFNLLAAFQPIAPTYGYDDDGASILRTLAEIFTRRRSTPQIEGIISLYDAIHVETTGSMG